jgi:hypothetical protein
VRTSRSRAPSSLLKRREWGLDWQSGRKAGMASSMPYMRHFCQPTRRRVLILTEGRRSLPEFAGSLGGRQGSPVRPPHRRTEIVPAGRRHFAEASRHLPQVPLRGSGRLKKRLRAGKQSKCAEGMVLERSGTTGEEDRPEGRRRKGIAPRVRRQGRNIVRVDGTFVNIHGISCCFRVLRPRMLRVWSHAGFRLGLAYHAILACILVTDAGDLGA